MASTVAAGFFAQWGGMVQHATRVQHHTQRGKIRNPGSVPSPSRTSWWRAGMAGLLDLSDGDEEDMDELEQMPDDGDEEDEHGDDEDEPPPQQLRQRPSSAEPPRLAIRDSVLKEVIACGWEEARTKISPDALQLTSALMHSFVHELRHRATAEAAASSAAEVTPEHLERILPQLLLDFGP